MVNLGERLQSGQGGHIATAAARVLLAMVERDPWIVNDVLTG